MKTSFGAANGLVTLQKKSKDWTLPIGAIRELVKPLELLGRVRGELDAAAAVRVNVLNQNLTVNTGDADLQIARLVGRATDNFASEELERLRLLTSESPCSQGHS